MASSSYAIFQLNPKSPSPWQPPALRLRRSKRVLVSCSLASQSEAAPHQQTILWRALKLPIYSVALVPLSVGTAVSFLHSGAFDSGQYFLQLASSVLVITWLNLSNDAYDAETGVDKDKKESVVNITGNQKGVLMAAYACLAAGSLGLVKAALASDLRVILLLGGAILCGYVYQCPPFRLSYKGVGEPLCFLAFGPLATTAFYLSQSRCTTFSCEVLKFHGECSLTGKLSITPSILAASAIVGLTTTLILFCSHFHQIEGDKNVGKMSPLVRLGTQRASTIVQLGVTTLYMGVGAFAAIKALPLKCALFCMLTLPVGNLVVDFVASNHEDKAKIFLAKYYCVRLHAAFGAALVLGLIL